MSTTEQTERTPSEELRSAAEKIRKAFADFRTEAEASNYWQSLSWRVGVENAMGGAAGTLAALITPFAARLFADILDEYAARYDLHVSNVPMACDLDHDASCEGHLRPICNNCASWVDADADRCTCWDNATTAAHAINGGDS